MMTPEQLRERAAEVLRPGWMRLSDAEAREILRAHADALEEIGRLNAAWKAQQFHLEAEERESEAQESRAERAESALAEFKKKCERLKLTLHEIKEEWAGAECGEPATAQEGYAIELCKRMYRIATEFKE